MRLEAASTRPLGFVLTRMRSVDPSSSPHLRLAGVGHSAPLSSKAAFVLCLNWTRVVCQALHVTHTCLPGLLRPSGAQVLVISVSDGRGCVWARPENFPKTAEWGGED